MNLKRGKVLLLGWLLAAAVASICLYQFTYERFSTGLQQEINQHLLMSFDEVLFSDESGRINDRRSILYVGQQINQALKTVVEPTWFAAFRPSHISLLSVDGIRIGTQHDATDDSSQRLSFELPRNHVPRSVLVSYHCELNLLPFLVVWTLLAVLLAMIYFLAPVPMSYRQRKWLDYLTDRGYDDELAYDVVKPCSEQWLNLNNQQWQVFNALHRPEKYNYSQAIAIAGDSTVINFSELQMTWFMRSLNDSADEADMSSVMANALALVSAADRVVIDLEHSCLTIHDRNIPVAKTPLFYYAWYAGKLLAGDGWMINPQSNKPDKQQGLELAELMWKHKGHAKAISDLEQAGLKAKTLDQNRSKIKEELVGALGEELAGHYLFDTEKDTDTGRTRYRLKLSAEQIELIS